MVLLGQETRGERGGAIDRWCPVVTAGVPDYWPVDGPANPALQRLSALSAAAGDNR
jgi:hypothetical protein